MDPRAAASTAQVTHLVAVRRQFLDYLTHAVPNDLAVGGATLSMLVRHPERDGAQQRLATAADKFQQVEQLATAFAPVFRPTDLKEASDVVAWVAEVTPHVAQALGSTVEDVTQRVLDPEERAAQTMPRALEELRAVNSHVSSFLGPRLQMLAERARSLHLQIQAIDSTVLTPADVENLVSIRGQVRQLADAYSPIEALYSLWRYGNYHDLLAYEGPVEPPQQ